MRQQQAALRPKPARSAPTPAWNTQAQSSARQPADQEGTPRKGKSATRQSRRRQLARPVALRIAGKRRLPARRAANGSRRAA
eukprot:3612805-Alexandrium_andersonii.AAC.1